jgi:hypothetical protein
VTEGAPIEVHWTGEVFRPTNGFWVKRAGLQYAEGEVLHIVNQEPRSTNSHKHYFSAVNEAWSNLPEEMAERWPTPDHLRKYALIRTGWCDSHSITCSSRAEALRVAAFIRPTDEFAVVDVKEAVVTRYVAKTQSYKMGKEDFQRSKDEVLNFLAGLIGTTKKQLAQAGEKAA